MVLLVMVVGSLAYLVAKFSDPVAHAIASAIPHAGPF
jgi:hypothetical protein